VTNGLRGNATATPVDRSRPGDLRGHRRVEIGGAAGLGEQQAGEAGGSDLPGQVADLGQRLRDRHHVDVHAGA
jgi:hypothetical protein